MLTEDEPPAFLTKREVLRRIPVSGPTLWNWSRTGQFPAPRVIGHRTVWLETDILAWMRERPIRQYKSVKE
jgi:predicted DNA-binding transcriptional regulator AlpA